jgi:type IV secretory pathway VirB10-like protein
LRYRPAALRFAMNKLFLPLIAALLSLPSLFAQDTPVSPQGEPIPKPVAPSEPGRLELIPSGTPQLSVPPLPDLPPPIQTSKPAVKPARPEPAKPQKTQPSRTEAAEADLEERIRFRAARDKVRQDPALQQQWDRAQEARTDYEKREILKQYYRDFYARVAKADPDPRLKKLIEFNRTRSLNSLEQTRIQPTEPPRKTR